MTSYELTEWMAYEQVAGTVDGRWQDDLLAGHQYLTQWSNFLLGAQVTEKGKKNPVPEPIWPARPWAPEPPEEDEEDGRIG